MSPKVRIEDTLPTGEKIVITLEGNISERRVLQVLELLKMMVGEAQEKPKSKKDAVWDVIVESFGDGTWFSIKDLYNIARKRIPELKLTNVSTYVSRFVNEGRLIKRGSKPNTRYKVRTMYARTP